MIDHHVSKFFETLFWIGALLTFVSFFYPRWFMITISIGIILMVMASVREGFRLRGARTLAGVIKKNRPKIIHRSIIFLGLIIVGAYLFFKQNLIYNILAQSYDLIQSPATTTWWVFVLIGIIIGIFILFSATKVIEVEYGKLLKFIKLNYSKIKPKKKQEKKEIKLKKKKIEAAKKDEAINKRFNFITRLFLEEESFWRRAFRPLLKKLEKRRAKKLKDKKAYLEELRKKKLEELKKKPKEEKILAKEKVKHTILPKILITLFISAIIIIFILYKKGKFSIENPVSAVILGLIVGLFMLYITMNLYSMRKEKKIKEEKKEKEVLQKIKKEVVAKASKYETDLDKLYNLINDVGSLTITEVAEGFGISKEQAEEWGKILESHNLIELNYPAIGELQLCKKKLKITK